MALENDDVSEVQLMMRRDCPWRKTKSGELPVVHLDQIVTFETGSLEAVVASVMSAGQALSRKQSHVYGNCLVILSSSHYDSSTTGIPSSSAFLEACPRGGVAIGS